MYGVSCFNSLVPSDGRSLGQTESVRILLKYGGDPTAVCDYHPPPLHLACFNGKLSILKVMVDMCGKEDVSSPLLHCQRGASARGYCFNTFLLPDP